MCYFFVPEQQIYFSLFPSGYKLSLVLKFHFEQFWELFFFIWPGSADYGSYLCINKVFEPLLEKNISRIFGKEANSAVLHHDSLRAHTAAATVQWLEDFGYNFIPARDWPADSPDLLPMDYSLNAIVKRRLWKRKARSVKGLKRAMRQKWSKVSVDLCVKTFSTWESRMKLML